MTGMRVIPLPALTRAMQRFVQGFGSSAAEVDAVAGNLIDANLCGHDSHGIGMLPRYADAFLEGGLKPNASVQITSDTGALLRLDGCAGFGQVIGQQAMALGIERAQQHGSCIVALGNAHHLGRIGAWAEQVAAAGLVSLHFVNVIARPIVAPFGGAFCAGVPLSGRPAVIVDFATSTIAQGKTRVAMNKGELVPPDCLIDEQGRPTREPRFGVVPPLGALLTFGAHKGYGLALLCELLGGALAAGMTQGAAPAASQGEQRRVLNGMFSVLIDPGQISERVAFEQEALRFVDWVQASPVREGFEAVQLAGDTERQSRAQRTAQGVPVDETTWQEILQAAARLGVSAGDIHQLAGLA
jgi:hydroxycarboxylate dehydrogenase B